MAKGVLSDILVGTKKTEAYDKFKIEIEKIKKENEIAKEQYIE